MPTTPILSISALAIVRDGHRVLDRIDWQINSGQHWAILGANGAGKTSLLSALTGYLTPSEGVLDVLGQRYGESNWQELRKKIGIVSSAVRQKMSDEETALVSVISGKYAMIDYWGRVKADDREEALDILKQIDAQHLAERPWRVLSQGERQRVLIGRALMAHPKLLILDEPCVGLDPVAREHFMQFVGKLTSRPPGKTAPTLILVTHHVEEVIDGFSHVLALKKGRVLAAGGRAEILNERLLSEAFGEPVRLVRRNGRFHLLVETTARRLFKAGKAVS